MNYAFLLVILIISAALIADDQTEDTKIDSTDRSNDEAVLQAHRYFAADFFNKCWDLIDKADRTVEDDLQMIHRAHASRAHWQVVGTPDNHAVGEWQISHVYAILNKLEPAMYHAQACLDICQKNQIGGFNLGFAYEALARAEYMIGNQDQAEKYINLGKTAANDVKKIEDRNYLLKELNNIIK